MRNKLGGYSLFAAGALAALLALGPAVPAGLAFADDAPVAASEDASAAKGASAAGAAAAVAGAPADPAVDAPADAADAPVDPAADGKAAGKAKAAQAGDQAKAAETYTVSFWGGATQEVKAGEKATPAPEPEYGERPDWAGPNGKMKFIGWVESESAGRRTVQRDPVASDLDELFDFSQPITRDVNLSAFYAAPDGYWVRFDVLLVDEKGHILEEESFNPPFSSFAEVEGTIYDGNTFNDVMSEQIAELEGTAKRYAQENGAMYEGLYIDDPVSAGHEFDVQVDLDEQVSAYRADYGDVINIDIVISVSGCDHPTPETFAAVVNDKGATIEIPVAGAIQDDIVYGDANYSAFGTMNGPNVPKGSRVYISRVLKGFVDERTFAIDLRLMVNGKPVSRDYGDIDITVRPGVYFADLIESGKTYELTVENADGVKTSTSLKANGVLSITFPFAPGDTKISLSLSGSDNTQNDGDTQDPSAPVTLTVTGAEGVKASGNLAGKNVPAGSDVKVNATQLKAGDAAYDKLVASMGKGKLAGVYDISLLVNGAEVHNEFGELTVVLPVDSAHNGHWVTVWHLHNDGSVTSERTVAVDGAVAFTVTDLSSFALEVGEMAPTGTAPDGQADQPSDAPEAEDGKPANRDDAPTDQPKAEGPKGEALPQTGDPAALLGLVAASGAAFTALGAASKRRR